MFNKESGFENALIALQALETEKLGYLKKALLAAMLV